MTRRMPPLLMLMLWFLLWLWLVLLLFGPAIPPSHRLALVLRPSRRRPLPLNLPALTRVVNTPLTARLLSAVISLLRGDGSGKGGGGGGGLVGICSGLRGVVRCAVLRRKRPRSWQGIRGLGHHFAGGAVTSLPRVWPHGLPDVAAAVEWDCSAYVAAAIPRQVRRRRKVRLPGEPPPRSPRRLAFHVLCIRCCRRRRDSLNKSPRLLPCR
mmetsp:Transcript_24107/g.59812  ORF Transcript_24107/g.59812 Transcript_24107/m.59812 type:complete len:211 (-) Transcript_24107:39-671(-)